MIKRKAILTLALFAMLALMLAVTAFAADNTSVKVTVKTSVGTREVNTTVGQVFTTTTTSSGYTITGVKGFGNYTVSAIKSIHIPYDATEVNITSSNAYVESLIIDNYSKAKITSLSGLTALKQISVSSSATVTFGSGGMPASLVTLDFPGKDSTITFDSNAFKDKSALTKLNFTEGNTYKLGANCFQNIGITELNLVDGGTFTFVGSGSFSSCTKLTYIYSGDGVASIDKTPFDNCSNLKMVYVEAATNIGDSSFRSSSATCELKVYVHTTLRVTFHSNAFSGRNNHGVVVCALEPSVTSFSNCKYELHYGLQHAYEPASSKPTCYNSYVTDCPCGRITNAKYKLYASGKSMQIVELLSGANPDIPHDFSRAADMVYENGIGSWGTVEMKCSVCENREGVVRPAPALFEFLGYSVSQEGVKSMTIGISFNSVVVDWYCDFIGCEVDYGVIASSVNALKGNAPLNNATGEVYNVKTVYKHDMASLGSGNVKISGFNSTSIGTAMVLAGYIRVGEKIFYIDNGGMKENVVGITYAQLLN